MQIIEKASDIEPLARSVPDSGGIYFVPAFSGLFAPYWRSDARGVIVGLTRAVTKAHLARAALEAICFQTRDVLKAMVDDSGVALTVMKVDGGITANSLCMQLQSDVMQIDISRPTINETTALGAAYAAGLFTNFFSSQDQLRQMWQESARWSPDKNSALAISGYRDWKRAIERTLDWV
jgi:glycerol kinase